MVGHGYWIKYRNRYYSTYDDSDNTLDFVIGTLNQDTTGNAATATALATARTIHGVSFDGTANMIYQKLYLDTVGAMVSF